MSNILIEISGFCIRFELLNNHPFIPVLTERYSQFVSSKKPMVSISVNFKKGNANPFKPALKFKNGILEIKRGDFYCKLDLKTRKGFLEIAPRIQSFDSFLRTLYSWLLARNNGILLHAAGAVINGRGYLFAGKSGAGKSTISELLTLSTIHYPLSTTILSDELIPLRIIDGKVKIYPSPFWGEMRNKSQITSHKSQEKNIELKKIFFLKKSKINRLKQISKGGFYRKMFPCVMNFSKQEQDAKKVLKTIDTLADKIQYFELKFSRTHNLRMIEGGEQFL